MSDTSSLSKIKLDWESDLNHVFSDEEWSKALRRIHTSSICARHSLIQFKLLHRIYWTKLKLSKINPEIDPICDRCRQAPATLYHTFWLCPELISFWTSIFKSISDVFRLKVEPCPLVALFGLNPSKVSLSSLQSNALAFCLIIAKRIILLNWKNPSPPNFFHWMYDLLQFIQIEKIRYAIQGNSEDFYTIWQPFLLYLKK